MSAASGRLRLLVLVGIPGSGKSTYAQRLQARDPDIRAISTDAIRDELYPGYEAGRVEHQAINHHLIFRLAYRALDQALAAGHSAVFDATNLTVARRRKAILIGQRYGADIVAHYFPVSPRTAIARNSGRERRVPTGAIVHMAKLLQPPRVAEGFSKIATHQ